MLLRQTKVDNEDLTVFPIKDEIRSFDISVDETTLVYLFDGNDHLNEDLNRDFEVVALL